MRPQHFHVLTTTMAVFIVSLSAASQRSHQTDPGKAQGEPTMPTKTDTTVSFARDVMPILERTCLQCHGAVGDDGEIVVEEGLNMTTYEGLIAGSLYGTVVDPGDPGTSYLMELIVAGDMPKEGDPLTPEEIETIRQWIAEGAANN